MPWACLLIWINLRRYDQKLIDLQEIVWPLRVGAGVIGLIAWYQNTWYTLSIVMTLLGLSWIINWQKFKRIKVLFSAVVIFLTLIFNQYLTARPVVFYNPTTILNFRVGAIPIEDFIYGLILVLGVVAVYDHLNREERS